MDNDDLPPPDWTPEIEAHYQRLGSELSKHVTIAPTTTIPVPPDQLTALVNAVLDSLATGVLATSLDDAVEPFIPYSSAPDQ